MLDTDGYQPPPLTKLDKDARPCCGMFRVSVRFDALNPKMITAPPPSVSVRETDSFALLP